MDEFQNYTVSSFETILAESAKYRLNLTLANQTLGQIPQSLQRGIFGNVATIVSFQISADDAPHLRKEMHRSRTTVRPPASNDYFSLPDFVEAQREIYGEALSDKNLGMSREDRQKIGRQYKRDLTKGIREVIMDGYDSHHSMDQRRGEIEKTLDLLDQKNLDVSLLRELFPDYEFRSTSFPEPDDFINLQPYHAFCRVERADNVYALRSLPAPEPNPETRKKILELAASRRKEHKEQEVKKPAEEKPNTQKTEDDYWVA